MHGLKHLLYEIVSFTPSMSFNVTLYTQDLFWYNFDYVCTLCGRQRSVAFSRIIYICIYIYIYISYSHRVSPYANLSWPRCFLLLEGDISWNSCQVSFYCNFFYNHLVRVHFYTCNDRSVVLPWAKLWPDIDNMLTISYLLSKMGPRSQDMTWSKQIGLNQCHFLK